MELTYQANIEASVETVFDLVSDIEHLSRWMDSLKESEYVGGFDPAHPIGTRFRQRASEMGQEIEYEGEIIEYERPYLFAVRAGNQNFMIEMRYRLTATEAGTHLEYRAVAVKASFKFRLLASAFTSVAEKTLARQMKNLQELAKTQS